MQSLAFEMHIHKEKRNFAGNWAGDVAHPVVQIVEAHIIADPLYLGLSVQPGLSPILTRLRCESLS